MSIDLPPMPDPVPGPWTHRRVQSGVYELLFNGVKQTEVMWPVAPKMEATLIRDIVDGLNTGYNRRHAVGDGDGLGAGEVTGRTATSAVDGSPAPEIEETPPQWGEVLNTIEEVAAWTRVHAVDKRSYWNGAALAHQAYLDEVTGRADIDRDASAA